MSVLIGSDLGEVLFFGDDGNDTVIGGEGNDTLISVSGSDFLFGGGGDDTLLGGTDPSAIHTLNGGVGNDLLQAGDGLTRLEGGAGLDTLVGGEGIDEFITDINDTLAVPGDIDIVENFTVGEDSLIISGAGPDSTVEYDAETGLLSVDGIAVFQLDPGLTIDGDDYLIL
ncbi:MAG: calcium-binding protein [Phormidesmis sp.]